jgi:hypothetical protein
MAIHVSLALQKNVLYSRVSKFELRSSHLSTLNIESLVTRQLDKKIVNSQNYVVECMKESNESLVIRRASEWFVSGVH